MTIKVKRVCHLGSTCEEVVDGEIVRCMQYIEIRGTDAQGKDHDKFDCSFAWVPILMLEQARHNMAVTSAVNGLRDDLTIRQDRAIKLIREVSPAANLLDK